MQSGRVFSRILQGVWEVDPVQGLVQILERDVTDAYHRGTVNPAQLGVFAYVISSASGDEGTIIYINPVLPMGGVDSPKCFLHVFGNVDRRGQHPG